jgi:hypothetical protein
MMKKRSKILAQPFPTSSFPRNEVGGVFARDKRAFSLLPAVISVVLHDGKEQTGIHAGLLKRAFFFPASSKRITP